MLVPEFIFFIIPLFKTNYSAEVLYSTEIKLDVTLKKAQGIRNLLFDRFI